jgi:hypothetical protein
MRKRIFASVGAAWSYISARRAHAAATAARATLPSTEEIVEEHKFLWDGSEPGWILLENYREGEEPPEVAQFGIPPEVARFSIVHEPSNSDYGICEDDAAHHEIIRRMLAAGVRVVPIDTYIASHWEQFHGRLNIENPPLRDNS